MSLLAGGKIREGDFIGLIMLWAASTVPTEWLECNGQAVSRTTYSKLFAIIGTTYGVGDGSTTFNVPNMKGKVVVGLDSGDGAFDAMGETGGEKTHTLTTDEIPSHTHTQRVKSSTTGAIAPAEVGAAGLQDGRETAATGGGQAHNNLQPYIVMKYIIKAAQA